MLINKKKSVKLQYNGEKLRKYLIRAGVTVIIGLLFLCFWEISKERIVVSYYEKTLYRATGQGMWLKYGRYEADTLYQRTLDKLPHFMFARQQEMQKQNVKEKESNEEPDGNEVVEEESELQESKRTEKKLPVHYAYGNLPEILKSAVKSENMEAGVRTETSQDLETQAVKPTGRVLQEILSTVSEQYEWKNEKDRERFLKNYYIADTSVGNVNAVIDGEKLLAMDTSLERIKEEPQILIYHTHGTEGYKDSREGIEADTVIGMGDILQEELTAKGFSVLHDRTTYDYVDGKDNRNYAYTTARPKIEEILEKYPSIEVILDIHRDSGATRRTKIDGKDTAQIMLFNGLCRNADGPIEYLPNPYLDETLAFSLQLNLLGRERYPGLMFKNYLKNYRYNMHFTGHCMLVELGTQNNTVEEAQNGVRYLAELLCELLTEGK